MKMLDLRPYQRASLNATFHFWAEGGGNPLIVIPTGGGKSLILAQLCKELLEDYPEMRIAVVTHVKELVQQNIEELFTIWPFAPAGIYSAGIGRRDTNAQITFMGIQSVFKKAKLFGGFDLLIVDEAHLIPRDAETRYGRFVADCKKIVPDMRIVGLTATPYRLDSGRLDEGDGSMFDGIAYEANVRDLIEQGYLSKLISKATLSHIDMTGVRRRGGDFVQSEMEARACNPEVIVEAVKEIVSAGAERKGWLVFCTSVAHARMVRDEIATYGVTCEVVTGTTPKEQRSRIIGDYKAKQIQCLISIGVLTTGFNAPHVDLIAMLRPTLSTSLYVQMVGRGFRLAPEKENCLVLDFAENVNRHGPIDAVRIKQKKAGGGGEEGEEEEEKVKICPDCMAHNHPAVRMCVSCGFEWPAPEPKHHARAEEEPILTTEKPASKERKIIKTQFRRHMKEGSPDSMRAIYDDGFRSYSQWICFEHRGGARDRAVSWWRSLGGKAPVPSTVGEALLRIDAEIGAVESILVIKVDKYFDIRSIRVSPEPYSGPTRVRSGFVAPKPKQDADDRQSIIRKIMALNNKTASNGCSEPEALAAKEKAAKLMATYGITAREVGRLSEIYDDEVPF